MGLHIIFMILAIPFFLAVIYLIICLKKYHEPIDLVLMFAALLICALSIICGLLLPNRQVRNYAELKVAEVKYNELKTELEEIKWSDNYEAIQIKINECEEFNKSELNYISNFFNFKEARKQKIFQIDIDDIMKELYKNIES